MGNDFCEHHGGMLRSQAQAEVQVRGKIVGRGLEWAWIDEILGVEHSPHVGLDIGSPEGDRQTWATQTRDGHTVYFQSPLDCRTITETVTAFDEHGRETVVSRRTRSYNLGSLSEQRLDPPNEVFHVVDEYGRGRTVRRGDLVRAPSATGKLLLQEQCRSCRYRNHDFDGMVEREHLKDLKCGVNPSYAESGVGECGDFEGEGDRNA